jgi:hypothetical protein
LNINSNVMTITMWINPNEGQSHVNGLFYTRAGGLPAGFGWGNTAADGLGYNWGDNAATYNYVSGLVPSNGVWSFVALIISPTNATLFLYNTNVQQSIINPVTNGVITWAGQATIGTDLYDATGARQFDGAIDEVAVFNQALAQSQINNLFTVATGIPVPAVIQKPLAGQTNFVNTGNTNALTYTVLAANGSPNLYYQWILTNSTTLTAQVLTNGANGFTGTLFSGATGATLAISNYQAALYGYSLIASVTNSVVPIPAQSTVALPQAFPTPAVWTVNFAETNAVAYNGIIDTGYTGFGMISTGTIWNYINVQNVAGVDTNVSSTNDLGTIPNTGVNLAVTCASYNGGVANISPAPNNSLLFDMYINLPTSAVTNGIVMTMPPGYYNLFIYSIVGSYANRGSQFTIGGTSEIALNITPAQGTQGGGYFPPNEDNQFLLGINTVIFTNVYVPSGTLHIGTAPDTSQASLCGLQAQFIAPPYAPITIARTTTNTVVLTWGGEQLLNSTTVNGTFTNVPNATSPFIVPLTSGKQNFYMLSTNGPVAGIPIIIGN